MKYRRAANITDEAIADVVATIDGWEGKLSWDLLVDAIKKRSGQNYTRQALSNHARILSAFQEKKKPTDSKAIPKVRSSKPPTDTEAALSQRLERMEAENLRLQQENTRLLEQFVRWGTNAYFAGVSRARLDEPLSRPPRDSSED